MDVLEFAHLKCSLCFVQSLIELVHGVSLLFDVVKSSILGGTCDGDTSDSGGGENFHLREIVVGWCFKEREIFIYNKLYDVSLKTHK